MFVQSKQSKGEKPLVRENMSSDWSCVTIYAHNLGTMWNNYLSIVGHSTEELQLQVKSTRNSVKEQPQAAGQILSEQELRGVLS